jgi:uncharacterized protein YjbJ (UPF0337 family)
VRDHSEQFIVFCVEVRATGCSKDDARLPRCPNKKRNAGMDWNRVEGNWKQFKGKVKEKWGNLTDDDLDKIAGRRDQLEGKIQERYGLAKDKVKKEVNDWCDAQKL